MKKCPYCAEEIQDGAIKCKHCGEMVDKAMKKKRSVGVTFFGWWFILGGIIGLLTTVDFQQTIQFYGFGLGLSTIVLSIVSLVCGILILKLSPIARKVAIISCVISILLVPYYYKTIARELDSSMGIYEEEAQRAMKEMKPEQREGALEGLRRVDEVAEKAMPLITIVLGVIMVVGEIIPIIFFTRPKVKEQFTRK